MKTLYIYTLLLIFFLSCSDNKPHPIIATPDKNLLFTITSDFATGSYSAIFLDTPYTVYKDLGYIHSDSVCRFNPLNEKIYILNRLGQDSIQILDPKNNLQTMQEFPLETGSNPQDIAFYSQTKAFVSLYDKSYILVINPATYAFTDKIDLSPFSDADGLPEVHQLFLHTVNNRTLLYATLQRLNRKNLFKPTDYSLLAIIDPVDNQILHTMPLKGKNPNSKIVYSAFTGALHVSSVGYFGRFFQLDGGIETIIPSSIPQNTQIGDFLYSEEELQGEISHFVILEDGTFFAIKTSEDFNSFLIQKNLNDNNIEESLLQTNFQKGGYLSSLLFDKAHKQLFIGDRSAFQPGVWIYDTINSNFIFSNPINVGLPPFEMLIIP